MSVVMMPKKKAYHRQQDLRRLQEAASGLPLVVCDNGRAYEVYAGETSTKAPKLIAKTHRLIAARHEVVAAFLAGWHGAQQRSLGTSLGPAVDAEETLTDLASRMLDMVERIEWVRPSIGSYYICPFCSAISERDGGPGHQDDCEGERVRRLGNELRVGGVLR